MKDGSDDRKIKPFSFHEKGTDELLIRLVNVFEMLKQLGQLANNIPVIEFEKSA